MSGFDVAVQFLDVDKMTYWGEHRDANFWIENAASSGTKRKRPSTRSRGLPCCRTHSSRRKRVMQPISMSRETRHLTARSSWKHKSRPLAREVAVESTHACMRRKCKP